MRRDGARRARGRASAAGGTHVAPTSPPTSSGCCRRRDRRAGAPRVEPGDVAVLAARRADLLAAQDALAEVGVPAVLNAGGGSVFRPPRRPSGSPCSRRSSSRTAADRVRAAALTCFFGRTAEDLDAGGATRPTSWPSTYAASPTSSPPAGSRPCWRAPCSTGCSPGCWAGSAASAR